MIFSRATKLRFRRRLRVQQQQVVLLSQQAEAEFERDFFKKIEHLSGKTWRFVSSWLGLLLLLVGCLVAQMRGLSGYFESPQPVAGGQYSEGIVGSFTNANPLYASSEVDTTVSSLVFAGLFHYNDNNQLVGNLAQSWSVNADGRTYTVKLKPNLTWQDGQPLTSADVAFTYKLIQNPDTQSPLESSWTGVSITTPNTSTIVFNLPNPLSSFPYSLTNGIVPQHLLANVPAGNLRSAPFNTNPVGAGPFAWQALQVNGGSSDSQTEEIELKPFASYNGGAPKLGSFVVHTYRSQTDMIAGFQKQDITAMVGLDSEPAEVQKDGGVRAYDFPLTAAVMTFFQMSQGVLADNNVRHALVESANTNEIIGSLGYPTKAVREPLLEGQLGYNPLYAQAPYNPTAAAQTLQAAGWTLGKDGVRTKSGTRLSFSLYAPDTPEYADVAGQLQKQWRAVGVDANIVLQDQTDFAYTLAYHSYDALLYGISIGVDPDVYAYWDSSQAKPSSPTRLNFSNYQSGQADASLEAGRTRAVPQLRAIKYESFLQAWQADAPALGLYQPRFVYVTRVPVAGLGEHTINTDTDRFDNVQNWTIRTANISDDKQD
ncbi:MAG TPA: ABC transporter substrate-binding protein [Candidatus Saccharimonadales bacterium]